MTSPRSGTTACVMCVAVGLIAGCASQSSIQPSEVQDERTGMTVGSLQKPIELIQSAIFAATPNLHSSVAYLGPVEWDNAGEISYGLWVHLAPANDWQFADVKAPGAVRLSLDDGSLALKLIEAPQLAHGPYQPVASWGQTAYFEIDVPALKRMAASGKIELDFETAGSAAVRFSAAPDAHETLMRYLHARGY